MQVFFTASTLFGGHRIEHNKKILGLLKKQNCHILSGEQIVNKTALKRDASRSKQEIFKREFSSIDRADFVVAEVTKPSHGVGSEITYALLNNKPVLALVYKENEERLSPIIEGNPSEHLYIEHYTPDNLHLILSNFIAHVEKVKKRKGKLIVIDGADGSGKTTQATLLIKYLHKISDAVRYISFPRYYNSFHGKTVAKFLRGEFGSLTEVSPYLASLAYALDRASMKEEMDEFLATGGYIVTNRYATSNMAHQGAKFKDEKSLQEYLKWVYELEYKVHKLPKEDVVIYLSVPTETSLRLTASRKPPQYLLGRKRDIHEEDVNYQIRTQELYLQLANKNKNWIDIQCFKNDRLLSPSVIQSLIIAGLIKKRVIES